MGKGAVRLLELASDPAVTTDDDALTERILDAALELAAASGLRHLTIDDVAARARVGRMTVYRRFGARQQLIDALAARECRRCLETIRAALDPWAPVEDRAAALFITTLRVIREHPLLARLARVEPETFLRELTRDGSAVLHLVREFLVAEIRTAQQAGELVPGDPEPLAELVVRLGASFVLMPDSVLALDDEQMMRETAHVLIAPALRGRRRRRHRLSTTSAAPASAGPRS
jgi:TetR/AcrR family transcriptional regulator, repressor for uid operon